MGPVLYRADEIARINEVPLDLIEGDTASVQLGITLWTTMALSERGHLVVATGPTAASRSEGLFLRMSVHRR